MGGGHLDLSKNFNPVPKPVKQRKEKPKTKYKEMRHHRKRKRKKKLDLFKGVEIPHRKKRSAISKRDYAEAIERHGEICWQCGSPNIQMHHAVFRSQSGRGGYRNLVPLCKLHHDRCHQNFDFADKWREHLYELYGPHFFKDRFDLWKEGFIHNCEYETFENFMKEEEERAQKIRESKS